MPGLPVRPRNDLRQYEDLADGWWDPRGPFAMLGWIAAARLRHIPPASPQGGRLLDVACGAGLLAPHLAGTAYRHVGVDLSAAALGQARDHGVATARADVTRLPFGDETFDVVVAGEILEHVTDSDAVLAEACRVLRPGGTLVLDTIAATWWGRFTAITVAERLPAGPPRRLHDGDLFVDRDRLCAQAARHGVTLTLSGLRPAALDYLAWLARLREDVRMRSVRGTGGLFQAVGRKAA